MKKLSVISYQSSVASRRSLKSGLTTDNCLLTTGNAAFTILELLAVFLIISVLAGIVIGYSRYALSNAAISRTQAEIAAMENALESYKNDNGTYPITPGARPTTATGPSYANSPILYAALAGTAPGSKAYMTFKPDQFKVVGAITYIVDPFGNAYNYYCQVPPAADQVNQATFDLWSYGPAGTNEPPTGIVNDIVNWRH